MVPNVTCASYLSDRLPDTTQPQIFINGSCAAKAASFTKEDAGTLEDEFRLVLPAGSSELQTAFHVLSKDKQSVFLDLVVQLQTRKERPSLDKLVELIHKIGSGQGQDIAKKAKAVNFAPLAACVTYDIFEMTKLTMESKEQLIASKSDRLVSPAAGGINALSLATLVENLPHDSNPSELKLERIFERIVEIRAKTLTPSIRATIKAAFHDTLNEMADLVNQGELTVDDAMLIMPDNLFDTTMELLGEKEPTHAIQPILDEILDSSSMNLGLTNLFRFMENNKQASVDSATI